MEAQAKPKGRLDAFNDAGAFTRPFQRPIGAVPRQEANHVFCY